MDTEDEFLDVGNITQDILLPFGNQRNSSYVFDLSALDDDDSSLTLREIIIIACYSLIVVVSIFGNLLVCNIVARRASMRRTTYVFIANLALSDLLMTVLNIPFNVARVLLKNWPFGGFMCSFVPLVQVTSVYVSTFTMMFIALDRYRVICKPLMPRLSPLQAAKGIIFVWIVAIILSLPHAIFNRVETVFTYRPLIRCRTIYPDDMSKWILLITFLTQYIFPLSVTAMAYFFIVARVWSRDVLGVVTEAQMITQAKSKRKTIKMLVLVVIFFAIFWFPLNVYHLLHEFRFVTYNSTIYFICHWLAMSTVCCNPFIYCWLNKNFRAGAYACLLCLRNVGRKLNSSFRSTREFRLTDIRCDFASQSYESRTDSLQHSADVAWCCRTAVNQQESVRKSRSLQLGSQRKYVKESVPMRPVCVAKCSNNSVSMSGVDRNKSDYFSLPEMETAESDAKQAVHPPMKKCSSWNQ